MRNSPFWWILVSLMVIVDIYFFQVLKLLTASASQRSRLIIFTSYWIFSAGAMLLLFILPYLQFSQSKVLRTTVFAVIAAVFFAKLLASVFFLLDDIRRGVQWLGGKFFSKSSDPEKINEDAKISRSHFLSWAGMIAGGGLFGSLIYGFGNKYKYQVRHVPLSFPNLPAAFRGIRIVQISDIHAGSFNDREAVQKGVQKILDAKPDLILFTGDLVNNEASEMEGYLDIFEKLKAPLGVYSVLGNHDYGNYFSWETPAQKIENFESVKKLHSTLGWKLLMNEHVVLERNGESIALLGVENWSSKSQFPKYGDMKKAYTATDPYPFKILMSHDPSHWDGEVIGSYPDVDLTLSGHTHGMQFGVEIPGFKWSPVQYVYRHWAGVYESGAQKLYVNRGYGFIGYPGRVGILPEITVIELT